MTQLDESKEFTYQAWIKSFERQFKAQYTIASNLTFVLWAQEKKKQTIRSNFAIKLNRDATAELEKMMPEGK